MAGAPSAVAIERTIDAEGVPILITEFPNPGAPPVVMLHGIGSRGQSWWPVIDDLAERFHLFQVDLRGHGGSGRPEQGYLLEDYAADLDAILDALDLAEPRILGHSLGALITLIWASNRPARAAALVLEDPSLHVLPEILGAFDGWQQLASLIPAEAAAWYKREYADWSDEDCLRRAETITSVAPGVFAELRAATEQALADGTTDRIALLTSIESPALLVYGNAELGSMLRPEDARQFVETIPHGQAVYVPAAGHSIHRDAPRAFLDAVVPFLDGTGWSGGTHRE
jgi:pimeloyl-ACP methyl ester carboxylesterase